MYEKTWVMLRSFFDSTLKIFFVMSLLVTYLFRGGFGFVAKWAAYLLLCLVCFSYSEHFNGRNVDAQLAGDWILVPPVLFAALFMGCLVTMLADSG